MFDVVKRAEEIAMKHNQKVIEACRYIYQRTQNLDVQHKNSILSEKNTFVSEVLRIFELEKKFIKSVKRSNLSEPLKTCKNAVVLERLLNSDKTDLSLMAKSYLDALKKGPSWVGFLNQGYDENSTQFEKKFTSGFIPQIGESRLNDSNYLLIPTLGTGWARTFEMFNLLILSWDQNKKVIKNLRELDQNILKNESLLGQWNSLESDNDGFFSSQNGHYYVKGQGYEYGGGHPEVWPQIGVFDLKGFLKNIGRINSSLDCSSFIAYACKIKPISTRALMDKYMPSKLQEKNREFPVIHLTRDLKGRDWDGYSYLKRDFKQGEWIALRKNPIDDSIWHVYANYALVFSLVFSAIMNAVGHQEINENPIKITWVLGLSSFLMCVGKLTKLLDHVSNCLDSVTQPSPFTWKDLDQAKSGDLLVRKGHVVIVTDNNEVGVRSSKNLTSTSAKPLSK